MQNKNNTVLIGIGMLVVGLATGWMIGGSTGASVKTGTHMMPDGTMMSDDGMSMSSMMADMNAALAGKSGEAFDKSFIAEMIVHHEGAVDMAKLALTNADHQEIKDLSQEIIAAQTKEITQMKAWQSAWFK